MFQRKGYENKNQMYCKSQGHQKQKIQYICQSPNCHYLPLCSLCKKKHDSQHDKNLIRFQFAIQKAEKNLTAQIKKLQQYLQPIKKKRTAIQAVQKQIQDLKQDKRKLIKRIQEIIDKQIKILIEKNGIIKEDQDKFYKQLNSKIQSLRSMQEKSRKQPETLRDSLMFQIEPYLYKFGKLNKYLTSIDNDSNMAYLYTSHQHAMDISQLELKRQILNPKLLKKVYNQSPLYFLIDPKCQNHKYLHYFVPQQQKLELRVYDVQRAKWSKYINRDIRQFKFFRQFSTVYDHQAKRFYYIGGKNGEGRYSQLSDQIIWYDLQSNIWSKALLGMGRYCPMSTIIYKKSNQYSRAKHNNYILIAGGIDRDGKVLKSWELFDPDEKKTIFKGQMNFASASGRLVTFNGDTIFRIGGLANKSANQLGVCPIVEKCDFSMLNNENFIVEENKNYQFNFNYIEIEDISKQMVDTTTKKYQLYYAGQGAIQINPNQIFVFGGRLSNGKEVTQSYVLNIQRFEIQNYKKQRVVTSRYHARWINQKPLISEKHFQNQNHCIWKGRLYSLQNFSKSIYDKYKGLIEFDMKSWYQTENIVDDNV